MFSFDSSILFPSLGLRPSHTWPTCSRLSPGLDYSGRVNPRSPFLRYSLDPSLMTVQETFPPTFLQFLC